MKWPWPRKVEVRRPLPAHGSDTHLVLEMLRWESLTVTMISRRTGMHRMTVASILSTLHALGYVYPQAVPPSILYHLSDDMYAVIDDDESGDGN